MFSGAHDGEQKAELPLGASSFWIPVWDVGVPTFSVLVALPKGVAYSTRNTTYNTSTRNKSTIHNCTPPKLFTCSPVVLAFLCLYSACCALLSEGLLVPTHQGSACRKCSCCRTCPRTFTQNKISPNFFHLSVFPNVLMPQTIYISICAAPFFVAIF